MSTGNEELIRRAYQAYASGDVEAMLAVFSAELEWTYLDPTQADPRPQVCHGLVELRRGLRRQAEQGVRAHLEEVITNGDRVLVVVRTPGVDAFRARQADDRSFEVFTVRDGSIVAMRACRDRNEALAVTGIGDGDTPVATGSSGQAP